MGIEFDLGELQAKERASEKKAPEPHELTAEQIQKAHDDLAAEIEKNPTNPNAAEIIERQRKETQQVAEQQANEKIYSHGRPSGFDFPAGFDKPASEQEEQSETKQNGQAA